MTPIIREQGSNISDETLRELH